MNRREKNNHLIISISLGLGLIWALLCLLSIEPALVVADADFTVTKFTDSNDGICDADCSLREAIIAANALSDFDTIDLLAGTYFLTISGAGENAAATGDLDITAPLAIIGTSSNLTIIDGGGLDRVFDIHNGSVVISSLTVRNGNAGGFVFGGGILNEANLTLTNTIISNNIAGSGGGISNSGNGVITVTNSAIITNTSSGNAGGIANFSDMTFSNSVASGNTANASGGGISSRSGGALTMTNSLISSNIADSGGGISNSGSILKITNSTISNNEAGSGGGIFSTSSSDLTVTNSTVSDNSGDGISNFSSRLTVINSTVSGNTSSSGSGIANFSNGIVTMTNSTVSNNIFSILGSGINNFSGVVTLKNTIVANNTTDDCLGTITSNGHNLDRDNTCNLTAAGDLADANPILGAITE